MAEPVSPGIFQVTLPDSQKVYVDLSAKPAQSIQFAGHSIEGNAIRIIRMNPDASSFTALGVKAIKGLIDMEQAGTISIRRDKPEEIQLTTDSGFALSPAWLGNPIRKVEVQNLSDAWIDLTSDCPDGSVPQGIVEQWSRMNERTLVNFRIQL
jgi:hypothetical protein